VGSPWLVAGRFTFGSLRKGRRADELQ
jgi:hypothetical protein